MPSSDSCYIKIVISKEPIELLSLFNFPGKFDIILDKIRDYKIHAVNFGD